MGRKIGLFGGTYNPVHFGHVRLARQLLRLAGLDEVWMMVSPQNPFKVNHELLPDSQRLEMVQIALRREKGIIASDYEFRLPKPSYTWNTLQALESDMPDGEFTLLIGGDNWTSFPNWYHHDDIMKMCRVVVYPRKGASINASQLPQNVRLVDTRLINISSTEVRRRIASGESIRGLVPKAVADYITEHGLYAG
ncbi:MAG: nicotinate-nucleotide adenylyltransferase [Prevotella sp.]|nr:nicotinate-nucleotide adenylyltransferase [Prevotella sp.]